MPPLVAREDWAILSMKHLTTSDHARGVDRCIYGAVSQALGRLQPPDEWLLLGLLSTNFYGVIGSEAECPLQGDDIRPTPHPIRF